jgi:protease-4
MNFLKTFLASLLGTFVAIIVFLLVGIGIIAGIIAAVSGEEVTISEKSVLIARFDKPIMDRSPKMPISFDLENPGKALGLNDILKNIRKAKDDNKISGIILDLSEIQTGISTLLEIREALQDFKTSGKFLFAYSEFYTQRSYFLASIADSVFLNPEGGILFKGLNSEMIYLKGTLEKLDIKMQILRHGKFKSATELFSNDKMSPEDREQISEIVKHIWDKMLGTISESRRLSIDQLNRLADSLKIESAQDALNFKFVDGLVYKDELLDKIKTVLKIEKKKQIPSVEMADYLHVLSGKKESTSKDKIAIVFAQGTIGPGKGDDQSIGSERMSQALRKARENDKVKAIVFRINSGGGSAIASDVIWREVVLAAKEKPIVASFGDVAASGGYYIACGASKIIADPTTITGSIGVWAAIPNMQGFFNKKLGITFDNTGTNKNSDFITVTKPLPPYQAMIIQNDIEHIYDIFTKKVAAGRSMTQSRVDSIGQGRIWSGVAAKEIGLIDDFGGLTKAVEVAAEMAKIKDYRLLLLPEQKDPFQQIIEELLSNTSISLEKALGQDYKYYRLIKEAREMKGVQARLPFEINIH